MYGSIRLHGLGSKHEFTKRALVGEGGGRLGRLLAASGHWSWSRVRRLGVGMRQLLEGSRQRWDLPTRSSGTGTADERRDLPTVQRGPVSFRKSLRRRRNPVNDGICLPGLTEQGQRLNDGICLPNDGIYLSATLGVKNEFGCRPRTAAASGGRGRDCNRSMVWRTESQNASPPEQCCRS